jgi:hypothetical protein
VSLHRDFRRAISKTAYQQRIATRGWRIIRRSASTEHTLLPPGNLELITDHCCLKLSPTKLDTVIRGWSGAEVGQDATPSVFALAFYNSLAPSGSFKRIGPFTSRAHNRSCQQWRSTTDRSGC